MFKKAMVVSLMLALSVGRSWAQESQAQTPPAASTEAPVTKEGNVSFDFRDADIQNVFRILSFKSGVNIVAGPEVAGTVTIKLDDVPWQEALEVILETYGYAYEKKGNIISVTTIENLKQRRENSALLAEQEPLVTQMYVLNFSKASDVVRSIDKMKSERGTINFDERTNTVIVTDIENRIKLISTVIDNLDRTTPQVLIEAKIVETNLNDSENLGIDWTTQATAQGAARPISYPFKRGNTNNRFAAEFEEDDFPELTYGTLDFNQFQAVLELLKSRTDTNILSNPKIVTLDNQSAMIKVGTENPIPDFGANAETGQLQTTGITYVNIGINFEVTPHVNNAGFVTLEITPEVSENSGAVNFNGIAVPLIGTEKVKTNVMVKDGETLVIAGLIRDKLIDTKKKIPYIGSVPVLGLLFQKTEKETTKQELIIFMTPHIITPEIEEKP